MDDRPVLPDVEVAPLALAGVVEPCMPPHAVQNMAEPVARSTKTCSSSLPPATSLNSASTTFHSGPRFKDFSKRAASIAAWVFMLLRFRSAVCVSHGTACSSIRWAP